MVVRNTSSPNLGKSFEDANHALSVLGQESACSFHHLLVVEPSYKHSRDDHPEHGKKEIIVLPEGVGIIDIYDC